MEEKKIDIDSFLDLTPQNKSLPAIPEKKEAETHVQDDYEFSRSAIRDIVAKGTDLFTEISDLARAGQQPEHYQVAATMMKATIDGARQLLELSKTHQKVTGVGSAKAQNVTKNTMNVKITSSDMLDMIKKMREQDNG